MDRNQTIGIVLITLLFVVYFTFFAPQPEPQTTSKSTQSKPAKQLASAVDTLNKATVTDSSQRGLIAQALNGQESTIIIENEDLRITFSNKGGGIQAVELKKFKTWDKKPLYLFHKSSRVSHLYVPLPGKKIDLNSLYFEEPQVARQADSTVVTYAAQNGSESIQHQYVIPLKGYTIKHHLRMAGFTTSATATDVTWEIAEEVLHNEMDIQQMRTTATVNWYTHAGVFENLGETATDLKSETINEPINWIAFKQKFFNSGIISHQGKIKSAKVSSITHVDDSSHIKTLTAEINLPLADLSGEGLHLTHYFGPNNYKILDAVAPGYERNIYLGWPIISWVNKYLVVNVFAFLEKYISNYGIIIILLVLLVKLILFPLSFRSYISMAKMKVLKPELDEIKARVGEDNLQAIQQEQMKLYNQVGINPLSGCVPLLLQMPVLLAMFNFFPNSIELRQKPFLWAPDLSTYDSVLHLPFSIPAYGDHVSLFTILMTISTLVWTWYNNQTSSVTGPMQSVSYIMPIVFMFILNSLPSGLSFYYFVSNVVSIAQQQIIKRFVDEEKLHKKLQENKIKNANKKKSGFAARLEEAMRAAAEEQKKQQQAKDKKRR